LWRAIGNISEESGGGNAEGQGLTRVQTGAGGRVIGRSDLRLRGRERGATRARSAAVRLPHSKKKESPVCLNGQNKWDCKESHHHLILRERQSPPREER